MKWALIIDGIVAEITEVDPKDRFVPELKWASCSGEVAERWAYDGSTFSAPTPPVPEIPSTITRRQFFQQASIEKIISQDEALAAVSTGAIPASLKTVIDGLPADQQFSDKMLISGATEFQRLHPLTEAIAQALGKDLDWIDDFWTKASQL